MTPSRLLVLPLAILALALPATAARADSPAKPDLSSAASAILIDSSDGSVILSKDPDQRRSMASTTKLMTALLTLEEAKPTQVFSAGSYRAAPIESKINLRKGERLKVSDLFEGMMLESANDAAFALAEGIAGSEGAFVRQMNDRARRLGLRNTSYTNPIGLDEGQNFSSARDLATLGRRLMRDPRFARVVDQPSAVLESGAHRREVNNRNDLVARYPYVKGIKTGHTRKAGYVLVGAGQSAEGAKVVSVVMGEPSEAARDQDSLDLIQYGLKQFRRQKVLDADRPVASASIDHRDGRAQLVPATDALVVTRRGERVRTRVDAPESLGKTPAGSKVGTVVISRGGRVVRRVPLVTAADVPGAGPLRVIASALGGPVVLLLALLAVCAILFLVTWNRERRRRRLSAERRRARQRERAKAEAELK